MSLTRNDLRVCISDIAHGILLDLEFVDSMSYPVN
jgi:hypothetical protein